MKHIICFLLSTHFACGLYFTLSNFQEVKFIKNVPESKTVFGNYACEIKTTESDEVIFSPPGACFDVQVYDPHQKIILSRSYGGNGRFSFQSHLGGEYVIVISPLEHLQIDYSGMRLHFSIDILTNKQYKRLNSLESEFQQLIKQVKRIDRASVFDRYIESVYRKISEDISDFVFGFAVGQVCLLFLVIFLQTKYLKSFFDHRKLL